MTALDAFADTPRWVAWRSEERGPKGELTKIPYGPRGRKAKANDRLTWFDRRGEAQSLLALTVIDGTGSHNWLNGHGGGIGIQLGDLGDGRHLGGVDLDSCLDENGTLAPWAEPILAVLDTYAETSPSGHGIKALFTLDATHVRPFLDLIGVGVNQWGTKRGIKGLNGANHGPGIEIYLSHRFFAITERLFPGKPDRIAELDQPALENLAKLIPQPRQDDPKNKRDAIRADQPQPSASLSDSSPTAKTSRSSAKPSAPIPIPPNGTSTKVWSTTCASCTEPGKMPVSAVPPSNPC